MNAPMLTPILLPTFIRGNIIFLRVIVKFTYFGILAQSTVIYKIYYFNILMLRNEDGMDEVHSKS